MNDDSADTWMISVDDHLIEPPDLFTSRLPSNAAAPRVTRLPNGGDAWIFEDQLVPMLGMTAVAGQGVRGYREEISYAEMDPACFDPRARVAVLDQGRIAASACFPTWVGFSGTRLSAAKDKRLGLACIQAYNDFVLDEWCGSVPGRHIPVVLVPLWDGKAAADELLRTAKRGARAVAFSENPSKQGYPSIHSGHWDPLFSVAQETGIPLCMHIGSSSHIYHAPCPDSPRTVLYTTDFLNAQYTLIEWLLSTNFDRFPGLRICLSEGGIGWVPHCIERCDFKWHRYAQWSSSPPKKPPSSYVADHVSVCLMEDDFGADQIERIGVGNVLVETDYPHADSSWPDSWDMLDDRLRPLSARDRRAVLRDNAEKLFRFQPKLG